MALERLSATDEAFLAIEDRTMGMHVGAVLVLDGGGLVAPDGSVAIERVRARVRAGIAGERRFAQRLVHVRGLGTVWVDARDFDPDQHVIHTALPRPGGRAELMRLAGRLFAQPLDRRCPLWELWVVEGLEQGRFAVVVKAHHAMVDGIAGLSALASMLSGSPTEGESVPARTDAPSSGAASSQAAAPRRAPSRVEIAAELARQRAESLSTGVRALRARARSQHRSFRDLEGAARGLYQTAREGLVPASRTAINPPEIGVRRGFAGVRLDLARVKATKRALGGTLNDLVLTTVTGGLRRYLERHGDDVDRITRFRALVPVDLRARTGGASAMGNYVSMVLVRLPIGERDPRARHHAVRAMTEALKSASHEIEGTAFVEKLADVAIPALMSTTFRVATHLRAFNVVVTNMRGPPFPLYLGPARILEMYALVPLFTQQALGIAIVSYDVGLFVGLHTDAASVSDGEEIARDLVDAFEELEALAASSRDAAPAGEGALGQEAAPARREAERAGRRPSDVRPT